MDPDPAPPNPRHSRKRTNPGHAPEKVRAVPGPQREVLDSAIETARAAQQSNLNLAADVDALRGALAAAQATAVEQGRVLSSLQDELNSKHQIILEMQHHEGQMEAQFLADQNKLGQMEALFTADREHLASMFQQQNELVNKFTEAQKLLMQRNEDVDRLQRELVIKSDEAIQLRAHSQLQALNTSKKQVPPRRKTRASMGAIVNTGARTIEIPLDPIPMAEVPEPSTESTSQPLLSATPRLAEVFDGDIDKLDKVLNDFAQLCLGRDAVVTVTPKKGTTAKKKSGSAKKKQDKPFMINYVHRRLRHFTCMKFEVEAVGDFEHHNPASEASVSACEAGEDPPDELFQWDFSPGYLQCRWNKLMIKKIVDTLLAEHEEDQEDFIEVGANRVFMENAMKDKLATWRGSWHKFQPRFSSATQHVETSAEAHARAVQATTWRGSWHKFQPRFSSATQHVETSAEAHARAVQAKEQHQLEMRSLALKTRKLEDRIETSTHTIQLKILAGTARDVETWKRMRDMVGHLGIWGMSSEEEADVMLDGQLVRIYKVKVCIWREPSIADYLRFVDAQTALNKKNQPGPKPAPRVRNPQHGFGKAAAPPGLPRSKPLQQYMARYQDTRLYRDPEHPEGSVRTLRRCDRQNEPLNFLYI
ncbi:hypothetical protein R3P38DRAFT_3179908 [Favolaschia claudopus]|uniref:Uncharacterized protein n=1 Tax=Favolaschia claudopus TaxID=2862362 RepID=A0AAW0CS08_9AGAR